MLAKSLCTEWTLKIKPLVKRSFHSFFFSFTQTWKHTHTHTHLEMTESFVIDVNRYNTHSRGKEKKDESEHTQRAD